MALNSQVVVQSKLVAVDASGTPVDQWEDVCTLWADVRHPSGLEQVRGDALISRVRASIRVRQRSGITAGMRALCAGSVYDVRAVLPDLQDRAYMDLVCELVS